MANFFLQSRIQLNSNEKLGAPDRIRTCNPVLRRDVPYPVRPRVHWVSPELYRFSAQNQHMILFGFIHFLSWFTGGSEENNKIAVFQKIVYIIQARGMTWLFLLKLK